MWSSSNRRSRLPKNWRKLREFVMHRDHYRCQWIEGTRRCLAPAVEVHHVIEAGNNGGRELNDPRFLIAICRKHHQLATKVYADKRRRELSSKSRKPDFSGHPGLKEN